MSENNNIEEIIKELSKAFDETVNHNPYIAYATKKYIDYLAALYDGRDVAQPGNVLVVLTREEDGERLNEFLKASVSKAVSETSPYEIYLESDDDIKNLEKDAFFAGILKSGQAVIYVDSKLFHKNDNFNILGNLPGIEFKDREGKSLGNLINLVAYGLEENKDGGVPVSQDFIDAVKNVSGNKSQKDGKEFLKGYLEGLTYEGYRYILDKYLEDACTCNPARNNIKNPNEKSTKPVVAH